MHLTENCTHLVTDRTNETKNVAESFKFQSRSIPLQNTSLEIGEGIRRMRLCECLWEKPCRKLSLVWTNVRVSCESRQRLCKPLANRMVGVQTVAVWWSCINRIQYQLEWLWKPLSKWSHIDTNQTLRDGKCLKIPEAKMNFRKWEFEGNQNTQGNVWCC